MAKHLIRLAIFSVALQAQSTLDVLNQNTQQLQVQVALDRSTYFPGEAAKVTATVTNPTGGQLQVMQPFVTATGCLLLFIDQPDGTLIAGIGRPLCGQWREILPDNRNGPGRAEATYAELLRWDV